MHPCIPRVRRPRPSHPVHLPWEDRRRPRCHLRPRRVLQLPDLLEHVALQARQRRWRKSYHRLVVDVHWLQGRDAGFYSQEHLVGRQPRQPADFSSRVFGRAVAVANFVVSCGKFGFHVFTADTVVVVVFIVV